MGLLSWFFPSPTDRLERAKKELARGRPEDARLELLDLDLPEARALLDQAENALALRNLVAAVESVRAGDDARAVESLELAERFHHGGHDEAFREARREMREIRAARSAAEEQSKRDAQKRALAVDPLGVSGGPSWLDKPVDPAAFGHQAEELQARLALIVENYPERLKGSVPALGAPFAQAVLDLDDGRPDLALQALVALPDQPLVAWERARASYAMGDAKAAIPAIRRFIEAAGHAAIGERHSATFLAQCLVETNDLPGALRVMRSARADEPKLGSLLYANLLELSGELPEAEAVLKALLPDAPKLSAAYVALARVRVRGGHRQAAMQALEASLQACGSCAPGQCGFQPPDLDAHRMLATLYLEDGVERERALQLAATARSLVQQPQWSDLYLAALSARSEGHPDARQLVDRLVEVTPQGTAAADKVAALLAS